jgi:ankyrin repeat protein
MNCRAGLLLWVSIALLAPLGFGAADARTLDDTELATLRSWGDGPTQQYAARVLARKLGAEKNLDAAAILLQMRDGVAMNWYVNEYLHGAPPVVPQSRLDAMALGVAKDPAFNADDASWDIRSDFLRLLGRYQSRELFQLFYDGTKRALIDRRAMHGAAPKRYFWVGTNMLVPDLPDIEEPDAALLPLTDDACQAAPLARLIENRHYSKAFDRLRDLYLRMPVTTAYCDNQITEAVASFQVKAGNDALVKRARWLANQAQNRETDQEISAAVASLAPGLEPERFGDDYEPAVREILGKDLPPQLKETLRQVFQQKAALALRYREFTPENLSYWITAGNADMVRRSLAHGVDVNAAATNGSSILAQAIATSRLDIVQPVVEAGADVNAPANSSRSAMGSDPLIFVAVCHRPGPGKVDDSGAIVSLLVTHGARVTEHSFAGLTVLQAAARCANRATVAALLSAGAEIDARKAPMLAANGQPLTGDPWSEATAMHFAIESGDVEIIRTLLEHKANVNAQMTDGRTPLLMAVSKGDRKIVSLLLDRGADVNLGTTDAMTPLQIARLMHAEDLESALRAQGARPSPAPVAMVYARDPAIAPAGPVSLARIDSAFLKTFYASRRETPFVGGRFEFEEDGRLESDAAQECRDRREFRLMIALDQVPTPDGRVAWSEYARYTIMLCEQGPFAPRQLQATIAQSLKAAPPELGDIAGFPLRIGNRTGRVTILYEIGHGVIAVPLALIPSSDARATLVIALDDQHIGEPGHETKRTLAGLADLVNAVDERSVGRKSH